MASRVGATRAMAGQGRHGCAAHGIGMAGSASARLGAAGQDRSTSVRSRRRALNWASQVWALLRLATHRMATQGCAGLVAPVKRSSRLGPAGSAGHGDAWQGRAFSRHGRVRLGLARRGQARRGRAWRGLRSTAVRRRGRAPFRGRACSGHRSPWPGSPGHWRGLAWSGEAWIRLDRGSSPSVEHLCGGDARPAVAWSGLAVAALGAAWPRLGPARRGEAWNHQPIRSRKVTAMKIRITLQGTAPLLCHNVRLANPLDPFAQAMKVITSKRKKTDSDYEALARLEFEGGLYHVEGVGPYLPGAALEKSIVEGARITRQGKQVERGLFVIDNEIPLLYEGPRDVEELWLNGFWSTMAVKPQGRSTVMRTRPMFKEWAIEAYGELDPGLLSVEALSTIIDDAGAMVGIGDYRPRYGRYTSGVDKIG